MEDGGLGACGGRQMMIVSGESVGKGSGPRPGNKSEIYQF